MILYDAPIFFGILSVVMMIASRGSYFISIFKNITRPHSFSWLIWGLISTIGFAAQYVEGAGAGSWARGFGAVSCFAVMILGFYRGEKNITKTDKAILFASFLAIPLWVITQTPVWSVVLVCLIDTVGYFPTIRKAWHKPHEETHIGYFLSACGAIFSFIAIEHYTVATWLYPVVLTLTNGMMAGFLIIRRKTIIYA